MLATDPATRPSAHDLLAMPFFIDYHDNDCEPTTAPFPKDYEGHRGIDEWKAMLLPLLLQPGK